ncbi:hypothetical protein BTJ_5603 [Burkholderia thailandensis E444]|uniref:hypothetical protein n=1 Tax=Burkholderia thailandensis TaxID=57975 RepID=UPI0003ECB15A|nr:hypothetical protein [Burkholderia thailandensis]AHI80686.1 hypothetical protein BTJ_5603 [Burkholderia thailandensis E444]MCS6478890.1 hypothetical protein [Burkholderia thailandensis]
MKASIVAIALGIALAACAPLRQAPRSVEAGPSVASSNRGGGGGGGGGGESLASESRRPANEVVDYTGRPCVNQTLYVKMRPCVFPQLQR